MTITWKEEQFTPGINENFEKHNANRPTCKTSQIIETVRNLNASLWSYEDLQQNKTFKKWNRNITEASNKVQCPVYEKSIKKKTIEGYKLDIVIKILYDKRNKSD